MKPPNVSDEEVPELTEAPSGTYGTPSDHTFQGETDWRKVADDIRAGKNSPTQNPLPDAVPEVTEVAEAHGMTLSELKEAAGPDWPEVEADLALAQALAHAVQTRRMRERGEVPPHYTATTLCAGCGPVPIWPGAPEHVLACPWCFNRVAR